MIGFNYIILLAIVAHSCKAAVLPTYLDRCCMDNSMNECIKNTANRALKTFALGDDHYNVYNYFPLRIPKVTVLKNSLGNFTVTNSRVFGFPLTKVTKVDFNLSAGTYYAQYTIEKVTVECVYDIFLTNTLVIGFGRAVISMRNIIVDHSFHVQMDNEGYPRVRNPTATYHLESTQYTMSNMDPIANDYMNTNSVALGLLFKTHVTEAFCDVLTLPYIAVFDKIKISDVIDFSCPMNPTTTPTVPSTSVLNLSTILTG